ncbi:ABC transporter ATP-binding protein, partial [Streptomyces sp. 900116325]
MSMEATAWTQLHNVMNAQQDRRPFDRNALRRIAAFARPHRRRVALFLVLSVATALLARAPPPRARPRGYARVYRQEGGPRTPLALGKSGLALAG